MTKNNDEWWLERTKTKMENMRIAIEWKWQRRRWDEGRRRFGCYKTHKSSVVSFTKMSFARRVMSNRWRMRWRCLDDVYHYAPYTHFIRRPFFAMTSFISHVNVISFDMATSKNKAKLLLLLFFERKKISPIASNMTRFKDNEFASFEPFRETVLCTEAHRYVSRKDSKETRQERAK